MSKRRNSLALVITPLLWLALPAQADDAMPLFKEHCASCHGETRLGGTGPALIPESLARIPHTSNGALELPHHFWFFRIATHDESLL